MIAVLNSTTGRLMHFAGGGGGGGGAGRSVKWATAKSSPATYWRNNVRRSPEPDRANARAGPCKHFFHPPCDYGDQKYAVVDENTRNIR